MLPHKLHSLTLDVVMRRTIAKTNSMHEQFALLAVLVDRVHVGGDDDTRETDHHMMFNLPCNFDAGASLQTSLDLLQRHLECIANNICNGNGRTLYV